MTERQSKKQVDMEEKRVWRKQNEWQTGKMENSEIGEERGARRREAVKVEV